MDTYLERHVSFFQRVSVCFYAVWADSPVLATVSPVANIPQIAVEQREAEVCFFLVHRWQPSSVRDVEDNCTSLLGSAVHLLSEELSFWLVSTQQRKTPNAAQRAAEQRVGQCGSELPLSCKDTLQTLFLAALCENRFVFTQNYVLSCCSLQSCVSMQHLVYLILTVQVWISGLPLSCNFSKSQLLFC